MTAGHLIKTPQKKADPNTRINLYDNYSYHIGYRILFTYAYIYLYERPNIGMHIQKMIQDGTIDINRG